MSNLLYRLGRMTVRRKWRVLGVWILALVLIQVVGSQLGGAAIDDFNVPGTESQQAIDLLAERFPAQAGRSGQVVFQAPAGTTLADPANRRGQDGGGHHRVPSRPAT